MWGCTQKFFSDCEGWPRAEAARALVALTDRFPELGATSGGALPLA